MEKKKVVSILISSKIDFISKKIKKKSNKLIYSEIYFLKYMMKTV